MVTGVEHITSLANVDSFERDFMMPLSLVDEADCTVGGETDTVCCVLIVSNV